MGDAVEEVLGKQRRVQLLERRKEELEIPGVEELFGCCGT